MTKASTRRSTQSGKAGYLFTLAHEIGHWCLHKDYLALPVRQVDAFGKDRPPTVICRSQANDRIEQQANSFAACLLMPERWVRIVWRDLYSRSNAMVFSDWQNSHSDWTRPPLGWRGPIDALVADRFGSKAVEYFCYRASEPMAEHFGVSSQAMRVRLEKLGLLTVTAERSKSVFLRRTLSVN